MLDVVIDNIISSVSPNAYYTYSIDDIIEKLKSKPILKSSLDEKECRKLEYMMDYGSIAVLINFSLQ